MKEVIVETKIGLAWALVTGDDEIRIEDPKLIAFVMEQFDIKPPPPPFCTEETCCRYAFKPDDWVKIIKALADLIRAVALFLGVILGWRVANRLIKEGRDFEIDFGPNGEIKHIKILRRKSNDTTGKHE